MEPHWEEDARRTFPEQPRDEEEPEYDAFVEEPTEDVKRHIYREKLSAAYKAMDLAVVVVVSETEEEGAAKMRALGRKAKKSKKNKKIVRAKNKTTGADVSAAVATSGRTAGLFYPVCLCPLQCERSCELRRLGPGWHPVPARAA